MKKEIIKGIRRGMLVVYLCFWFGCQDFLETEPYGTTTFAILSANETNADGLLVAAYSNLDGVSSGAWHGAASNWIFGSILGGDAYTGSTTGDQPEVEYIETYERLVPANIYIELKWVTYYNGIARSNEAIKAFNLLSGTGKDYNTKIAEARFLRGLYHFELYKIYRHVPFIDETLQDTRIGNQDDILPRIQDDFLYASTYLPPQPSQPGRVTKGAAHSFLGITKMWQENFEEAKEQFDIVIQSGIYELNSKYHDNFNADLRTSTTYVNKESILEVQQSVNDNGQGYNGNYGDVLNYVYLGPGGCCGFHQPSQNLVNAFKTDAQGLPLLDSYNDDEDVINDDGILSSQDFTPDSRNLDPRLDWTVGRREIPYLDWGKHPGEDWIRNQVEYGPYSPKKYTLHKSQQENFSDATGWTAGLPNVNNFKLLRYADILLYAAEAEIELGNLQQAREYVNQVRRRAANKDGFVKDENGNDAANYVINEYASFPDETYARKAVRFERRLELGMEGHRLFDLVRWGVAAEEKTAYFEKEKDNRFYMQTAVFEKGKHELMPIPNAAILLSYKDGVATLEQNHGY